MSASTTASAPAPEASSSSRAFCARSVPGLAGDGDVQLVEDRGHRRKRAGERLTVFGCARHPLILLRGPEGGYALGKEPSVESCIDTGMLSVEERCLGLGMLIGA